MSRQLATHTPRHQRCQPRYQQLADALARDIHRDYTAGDLLPAETALAARFNVNRHTVRRALDELVAAGLVTRHQGRGTQVVNHRLDYRLAADSKVTRNLAELGLGMRTECLEQGLRIPPQAIAQCFGRRPEQLLLCVDTLRLTDDVPLLRLRHWFDDTRLPGWTQRYRGGSTRAVLEQHYGLHLRRRQVHISATLADREDHRLLQCPQVTPLLALTSHNVDDHGALVEISVSRARADRMTYHINFDSLATSDPEQTS